MNVPPDIGMPPSPGAYIVLNTEKGSNDFSLPSQPKHKTKKSRNKEGVKRSRSRSPHSSFSDSSTKSVIDMSLQAGQCTPPTAFSTAFTPPAYLQEPSPYAAACVEKSQSQQDSPMSQVGRQVYGHKDVGPFTVHVQRIEESLSEGATLHPVTFGRFLFTRIREFPGVIDGSLKSIGRNRVALNFVSADEANKFIQSPTLPHNKFKAFIPTFSVTKMGIVRGVPCDWSPEEIVSTIKVPEGCGPVIKARRLNFKINVDGVSSWKPSQTVVLFFDGQVLPKRVFMYYNSLPVELYSYPIIQCFHCCRYGHTKAQCRSKARCFKCGHGHMGESCTVEEDSAFCVSCSGKHFASNKTCPEAIRQRQIKNHMAQKSVSYSEAAKVFAPVSKSYADVLSSAPGPHLPLHPSPPQVSSYKKTVIRKSRPPPPSRFGYDKEAHYDIVRQDVSDAAPNGCALMNQNQVASDNNKVVTDLINIVMNHCSTNNTTPYNAAPILNFLISLINNGSFAKNVTVEL